MNLCRICNRNFKSEKSRKLHERYCQSTKENSSEIRRLYDLGLSFKEIWSKGFLPNTIHFALKGKMRTTSEAIKLAHKNKPYLFKWSLESKLKLSNIMKKAIYKGWKKKSYSEEFFEKFLININLKKNKDFYRETPFEKFRADFYFPKIKLVIEIDGRQHQYLNRQRSDREKDKLLIQKYNLEVFRITWHELYVDTKSKLQMIEKIIKNKINNASVTQLVESLPSKQIVESSSLFTRSILE